VFFTRKAQTVAVQILVVDDEPAVRTALHRALRLDGYDVELAGDGAEALAAMSHAGRDAVLLDVLMPGIDGLEVCRELRRRGDHTPVLMLTARDGVADRVAGLDAGADDYLVKPFEFDELNARMRAVLRRNAGRSQPLLEHDGVTLDPATREVKLRGEPVLLSAREFAVLEALMIRPGAILSRTQLEDRLYGWGDAIESNAVSVYVHQLRRKLGAEFIQNMRGVGYFLRKADAA
jgi:two-component system OmpR family response regulator/two-component system response regulator QseB